MEPLQTWWATELYPTSDEDNFGVVGNFEVVKAADAQATIAALQADNRTYINERHENTKQIEQLQADLAQRTAELERVSLLSSHNERRFEEVDKKYKDLRTLIAALPKVEGEITCSQQIDSAWRLHYWQVEAYGVADECIYRLSNLREEEAKAYATLLQHRQGMEG